MRFEDPGKGRARIDDRGYELEIVIPSKKKFFMVAIALAGLGGWAFGLVMVITQMLPTVGDTPGGVIPFLVFWLFFWCLWGASAIYFVVWNLFGTEKIIVNSEYLEIRKTALITYRKKRYRLQDIANLRISQGTKKNTFFDLFRSYDYWQRKETVFFDYGMKTVKFGDRLDDPEAAAIVENLQKRIH